MACKNCELVRKFPTISRCQANCIYCGARMIQAIQSLRLPDSRRIAMCRAELKIWVDWGHSEARIRELVKGPRCIEPLDRSSAEK